MFPLSLLKTMQSYLYIGKYKLELQPKIIKDKDGLALGLGFESERYSALSTLKNSKPKTKVKMNQFKKLSGCFCVCVFLQNSQTLKI